MVPRRSIPGWLRTALLALAAPLLLAGCGAGLITGLASSRDSGTTAAARPPELTIGAVLPLVPVENTTRTVVVANSVITAGARLRVEIEAAGLRVPQRNPTVSGQGGSTSITFTLDTAPITAPIADLTAADVDARLRVLVDDREVAPAVAIVLVKQPRAALVLPSGATERFVSPLGQRVELAVTGLRHADATNLQMVVVTRDPTQIVEPGSVAPRVLRVCSGLTLTTSGVGAEVVVAANVPGNVFPDRFELFVRDLVSGQSTVVDNAYYQPAVALALPSQGATTGGTLVSLFGTALVPHDFTATPGPAPLAFGVVTVSLRKGGRETFLPREDFRIADSSGDRLVFAMPASPDGRPGQVDIVLSFQLDGAAVEVVASGKFLFANPDPFFGPRGAVLQQLPVAVAPIDLDAAPLDTEAPDFAVLTEEGGAGYLQLLLALENGMFQRFGARRRIGDYEVPAERGPRDLCTGDFDGDAVPDMFVANEGATRAVHHLVLGQEKPATPLGAVHRIDGEPGTFRCRTGDFDRDGRTDLLLVPGPNAPVGLQPQVRLSRPLGRGRPAFTEALMVPVRSMAYEAIEVADLDGDGNLDIAVVSCAAMQLDVAYGLGNGSFAPVVEVDFTVPNYSPDPASPAVGLHACRDGAVQSLGLVIAGLPATPPNPPGSGPTPPLVAVIRQPQPRVFTSHVTEVVISPTDPLGVSLADDLDQANTLELAVGVRGVPSVASLGLLRFGPNGFQPIVGGVETGAELPRNILAMHFGRAFPPTPLTGEAKAIFIVHQSLLDDQIETRLSTRLLYGPNQSLTLLPPDAGDSRDFAVEGIVGGNFRAFSIASGGGVRDLALGRLDGIALLENDGFGGYPKPVGDLAVPGLLPRTMLLLPAPAGQTDGLTFFDATSRLGGWYHDPLHPSPLRPDFTSRELRLASPTPRLQTALLANRTRVRLADVDGDQVPDLVALLAFDVASPGEGDALLALLRGRPSPRPNEFPFYEPTVLTPVHGNATAFALGDFAAAGGGLQRQLEVALAVPVGTTPGAIDGDHVRFYRYVAGASPQDDHFAVSFVSEERRVLLAGSRPTELEADDFDGDGLVDLLVAAAGDEVLRILRNIAPVAVQQGEVAVGSFVESQSPPLPLPDDQQPEGLRLGDVNGDGSIDILAVTTAVSGGQRSTEVSFYLSTGPGVFGDRRKVSPARLGDRNARLALDLGDWNRDGVLDLFLGWNSAPGDRNVRVLFGGSR